MTDHTSTCPTTVILVPKPARSTWADPTDGSRALGGGEAVASELNHGQGVIPPRPPPRSSKPICPFDSHDDDAYESWKLVCKTKPG